MILATLIAIDISHLTEVTWAMYGWGTLISVGSALIAAGLKAIFE